MQCPRAVVFDLDGTLADALTPPTREITVRLEKLLALIPVAIMSAASFKRISERVLPHITAPASMKGFYVFADTSSQCFECKDGSWTASYSLELTAEEKADIRKTITDGISSLQIIDAGEAFTIDVRETQVTFAALELDAPLEVKKLWDPSRRKRQQLKDYLETHLPGFDATIGGWRSIDITRKGIDKAYGISWLSARLEARPSELLFVGDAFYPGGNDFPVLATGAQTLQVAGPNDTQRVIDQLLDACKVKKSQH